MQRLTESITVMEPVTYETSILTGTAGPTLAQAFELNGWPIARCQPIHHVCEHFLIEPHYFQRGHNAIHVKSGYQEACEPTWFIGGISEPLVILYQPHPTRDVDLFHGKHGPLGRGIELSSKMNVSLPAQVTAEIARATASGLFTWHYYVKPAPAFVGVSYDWRIFHHTLVKRPDPIILGFGVDQKWHVIAAWNIDLDLAVIAETAS